MSGGQRGTPGAAVSHAGDAWLRCRTARGKGASGIVLQPTAGVLLGRLSSVQLRAEVGYFVNTFGEREQVPMDITIPSASEPNKHFSHGFVLNVGLGF